jgi:hypothetical protein
MKFAGPHTVLAPLSVVLGIVAFGSAVQAQTVSFACEKGRGVIALTVTSPNTISVTPIEGRTMQMRKRPDDPRHFINGDYGVIISPDHGKIELEIPDFGRVRCQFNQRRAAAPPRATPPRTAPRAAARNPANPCPPGQRPVPETDRCVPVGTSPANEKLPMWGRSLGGIVRGGPSMSAPKIASLPNGAPVQIVESTNTVMGDYHWFRIEFNGRPGFQWGGIMCSEDPLPGILERCRR